MNSVPAEMAELADALVSGTSDQEILQVQVLFSAPKEKIRTPHLNGEKFGFLLYFDKYEYTYYRVVFV